jgi:predicted ATP-grasp superfamily ATP-dependent carboligase
MKPTAEMILKAKVGQQTAARILWNEAKKKAAAKKVDTKAFNKNLGPALDAVRDAADKADKEKTKGNLDAKTKQAVKQKADDAKKIIKTYSDLCDKESKNASLSDDTKKAWTTLKLQLQTTSSAVDNATRPILK